MTRRRQICAWLLLVAFVTQAMVIGAFHHHEHCHVSSDSCVIHHSHHHHEHDHDHSAHHSHHTPATPQRHEHEPTHDCVACQYLAQLVVPIWFAVDSPLIEARAQVNSFAVAQLDSPLISAFRIRGPPPA